MKRSFIKNGDIVYYIIDMTEKKMLLQRKMDGEIVIAVNYEIGQGFSITWQHGNYFGHNLIAAAQEFYGKGA